VQRETRQGGGGGNRRRPNPSHHHPRTLAFALFVTWLCYACWLRSRAKFFFFLSVFFPSSHCSTPSLLARLDARGSTVMVGACGPGAADQLVRKKCGSRRGLGFPFHLVQLKQLTSGPQGSLFCPGRWLYVAMGWACCLLHGWEVCVARPLSFTLSISFLVIASFSPPVCRLGW